MSSFEAFKLLLEQIEDKEKAESLMQQISAKKKEVDQIKRKVENTEKMIEFHTMQLYKLKEILKEETFRAEYSEKLYKQIEEIYSQSQLLLFLLGHIEFDKIRKYNELPMLEQKKCLEEQELKAKEMVEQMENRDCVRELRALQEKLNQLLKNKEALKKGTSQQRISASMELESVIQKRNSQIVGLIKQAKRISELRLQVQQQQNLKQTLKNQPQEKSIEGMMSETLKLKQSSSTQKQQSVENILEKKSDENVFKELSVVKIMPQNIKTNEVNPVQMQQTFEKVLEEKSLDDMNPQVLKLKQFSYTQMQQLVENVFEKKSDEKVFQVLSNVEIMTQNINTNQSNHVQVKQPVENIFEGMSLDEVLPQITKPKQQTPIQVQQKVEVSNGKSVSEIMRQSINPKQVEKASENVFKVPLPKSIHKGKSNDIDLKTWYEGMNFGKYFESKTLNINSNPEASTSFFANNNLRSILRKPNINETRIEKHVTIISPVPSTSSIESYLEFNKNNPINKGNSSTDIEMETENSAANNSLVKFFSVEKSISKTCVEPLVEQYVTNVSAEQRPNALIEQNLNNDPKEKPVNQLISKASIKQPAIQASVGESTSETSVEKSTTETSVEEPTTKASVGESIKEASPEQCVTHISDSEPEEFTFGTDEGNTESKSDSKDCEKTSNNIETKINKIVTTINGMDNGKVNDKDFTMTLSSETEDINKAESQALNVKVFSSSTVPVDSEENDNLPQATVQDDWDLDFNDNSNKENKTLEIDDLFDDSGASNSNDDFFDIDKKSKSKEFLF